MLDTIHPLSLVFYHTPKTFTRAKSYFTRTKLSKNPSHFYIIFQKKATISQDTVAFFENINFYTI